MFRNYIKIAFRHLRRHPVNTLINISGLTVGMTCCAIMLLFVKNELNYDDFHKNAARIYRVTSEAQIEGEVRRFATTSAPLTDMMRVEFPRIEHIVRFFPHSVLVTAPDNTQFQEDAFYFCDSTALTVFNFPLKAGDPGTALDAPHSLVLTQTMAEKYFGDSNPLGKTLRIEDKVDMTVTGVLQEIPATSHIHFDFLANIKTVDQVMGTWVLSHGWHWPPMYTYVQLPDGISAAKIEAGFPRFIKNHLQETEDNIAFHLQSLRDIYLHSNLEAEIGPTSSMAYIYIFSLVAFFVLVIACINFMNLATARSSLRAREVGLRKVVGAGRKQMINQFLGEAVVYAAISMLLAILLMELLLPTVNQMLGKTLQTNYLSWQIWVSFLAMTAFVGLLAGSYPAFFLTRFKPVQTLQGASFLHLNNKSPINLRTGLVVFQFIISITLIAVTIGMQAQLNFIHNSNLGFDKEHIVIVPIRDEALQKNFQTIKNRFLEQASVLHATAISNFPWEEGYYGFPINAEGVPENAFPAISTLIVDADFLETFDIKIVEGRGFSNSRTADAGRAFILNQSAVEKLGWESAINKRFSVQKIISGKDIDGRVVGVIQDIHLRSLHHLVEPLVVVISPVSYYLDNLAVRITGDNLPATLRELEKAWQSAVPNRPFDYFFMDTAFNRLYQQEQRLSTVFNLFAGLTIFVACLGMFGLATFSAQRRVKEIGIRKVLGASLSNIVVLLSKDFIKLVLAANLVAWPLGWYLMHRWLQDFAYRIEMSWWVFALAGGFALVIAVVMVSSQAIRAALANPVDSLRYE